MTGRGGSRRDAGDGLEPYRSKRRAGRTPEPFAIGSAGAAGTIFVVQRHDARRLHFDLRLERDGVLASWAVPKGIPLEPGEQHLAVHVEDHPLSYATFEGEIPKGEYGAGSVEIWDSGTYELLEEKADGGLTVRLRGSRLDGVWTLVPARLGGEERNWLLLRKRGGQASPPRYAPMLATATDRIPAGAGWAFEVKFDGFRAVATVRGGAAELRSRQDNDLTARFPSVVRALPRAVGGADCVLDGEVCALDERGRSSFSAMQQGAGAVVFYVFDVLELDGEPLVDLPLRDRQARLAGLVAGNDRCVRLSAQFDDGEALLEAAEAQGLEGIVAKRIDSPYQPGRRTRDWLKVKLRGRQEFVVAGYTRGQGRRRDGFGALVLGVNEPGGLRYVGNVGTGFSDRVIDELCARLGPLETDACPFHERPTMAKVRRGDVVWVEPRLVVEVEFAEWTRDGRLRAPSFRGLREDKPATEVRREVREPMAPEVRRGSRTLRLSNLDKPFFPEAGLTKGDLLAYYRDVARVVLPHLRNRPFTMKRYPDGWQGSHFFQKDAPRHMPDWIPTRAYVSTSRETRGKRTINYPLVNDELALLWVVNMGCIDLNTWYSRVDRPERPDWVLFDLDPSDDVGFAEVIQVARLVREVLDGVGLEGYAKTSGSDGIHVLVPIARRSTYAETRAFSEHVARALASAYPGLVTTEWTKARRRGVLIDANQNGEGKTIASAYSVRPRAGAPVSTPLRWQEVVPGLDPAAFTIEAVLDRVARDGDLFAPVLQGGQSLSRALRSL